MKNVINHTMLPETFTASELKSSAYMGHTVYVDGKKATWQQLREMGGQRFNVKSITTEGINNTYKVESIS